jgi:hypothetical protein
MKKILLIIWFSLGARASRPPLKLILLQPLSSYWWFLSRRRYLPETLARAAGSRKGFKNSEIMC